ncbi:MAG: hypothetical protein ACE5EQ_08875, partial [Phycisphaerae bacterium]
MKNIQDILRLARTKRATDVHIVAGSPVLFRIEGDLQPVTKESLTPKIAQELSLTLLSPEQVQEFEQSLDFDFMAVDADRNRYRVNVSYNDSAIGSVLRLLPREPMTLEAIRLPEIVGKMARARKGLILITGSTSQGKS